MHVMEGSGQSCRRKKIRERPEPWVWPLTRNLVRTIKESDSEKKV
jgi:hypothetical protein